MKEKLQRIALVPPGLKPAGLQRIVCDLAKGMASRGIEVTVIPLVEGGLESELLAEGIDVRPLSHECTKRNRNVIRPLLMAIKMACILRSNKIQAINIHGFGAERIALLATTLVRTHVKTFVFHSNYPKLSPDPGNVSFRRRATRVLSNLDHCIAVSDAIMNFVFASDVVKKEKITCIQNGVDISRVKSTKTKEYLKQTLGFNQNDILLLQVGRFQIPKNQHISVKAMSLVLPLHANVHLLFAGNGPQIDDVRKLAYEIGVSDHIHFLGHRSDIKDILGAADLFLLPSSWEGLPISLLEACANSIPIVGSNVPGIADTVAVEPESAKLVPPGREHEFAAAIHEALADPEWMSKAKTASYSLAKRFTTDQMVDKYIDLHESLLMATK